MAAASARVQRGLLHPGAAPVRVLFRQRRGAHAGGAVSLLQMAKTAAALSRLAQAHLPFISVMTDPTTGGVSASLALLGT